MEHDRVALALKEAEYCVKNIQDSIDQVNRDLLFLCHLERQLSENITVLKQQHIVTLAPEFRKIRMDLDKCRAVIQAKKKDQADLLKISKEAQDFYKQMKSHHDNVMERLENNVLYGNFGRNNE